METDSMKRFTDTPLWNSRSNKRMWDYYLNGVDESMKGESSPFDMGFASIIPRAYIKVSEFDALHDEGALYRDKIINAGGEVVFNDTKGTYHCYDILLNSKVAKDSIKKRIEFMRESFERGAN